MAKNPGHVLYIDDEVHIQEVAQMCLEMVGGFKVTCLSSGLEAIQKIKTIDPDLVLLDVMMPQMDGPSTLKELQEKSLLSVPVIFMTARVQPEEIKEYLKMGAAGVVPKPFDPMTISDQINEIWEKLNGTDK